MLITEPYSIKSGDDFLTYRENTWDQKSLGFKVGELLNFKINSKTDNIIRKFIKKSKEHNFRISIARLRYDEFTNRKALVDNQFEMVEMSYEIRCKANRLKNLINLDNQKVSLSDKCDLQELLLLAGSIFHHGRFTEDSFISKEQSDKRYINWCIDLYNSDKGKVFMTYNNKLVGFMFFEVEAESRLLLGGMSNRYSHLSILFWSSVFSLLPKQSVIKTLISASNLGVVNLYSHFGFIKTSCLCGYRRINEV